MGVVVRRYIDFLILLISTPLVSVLFAASSLLFVHLKKCFSFFNNNKKVNRTECSNLASFKLLQ